MAKSARGCVLPSTSNVSTSTWVFERRYSSKLISPLDSPITNCGLIQSNAENILVWPRSNFFQRTKQESLSKVKIELTPLAFPALFNSLFLNLQAKARPKTAKLQHLLLETTLAGSNPFSCRFISISGSVLRKAARTRGGMSERTVQGPDSCCPT